MKIEDRRKIDNEWMLDSIAFGACFTRCGILYMKTCHVEDNYAKCVRLSDGTIVSIKLDERVVLTSAKVVIE